MTVQVTGKERRLISMVEGALSSQLAVTTVNGTQAASTTLNVADGSAFITNGWISYQNSGGTIEYRQITAGGGTNAFTLSSAHGGVNNGAVVDMIPESIVNMRGNYGSPEARIDGIDKLPGAARLAASVSSGTTFTTRTGISPTYKGVAVLSPYSASAEVVRITAISGTTVTVAAAIANSHAADAAVLLLYGAPRTAEMFGLSLTATHLVGGYYGNTIASTLYASVIAGGGQASFIQSIGGNGNYATIGGGYDNTNNQLAGTIAGGAHHTLDAAGDHGTIGGGSYNAITGGAYATISGGTQNTASGTNAVIGGGYSHIASGPNSTIAGGNNHSATGDGSTVAGGANNDATALGAAIGGGTNNDATGQYATVAGGTANLAGTGTGAAVGGGGSNTASGAYAVVPGGNACTASGNYALAAGLTSVASGVVAAAIGRDITNSGDYSFVIGRDGSNSLPGAFVHSMQKFSTAGDAQILRIPLKVQTTSAAQTTMGMTGGSTSIAIPTDTTYGFVVRIAARRTDADNESAFYEVMGCIDNNAGTTALVGAVTKTTISEDTAAWDVDVVANDSLDILQVKVTGEASKTINWVAMLELIKVTG